MSSSSSVPARRDGAENVSRSGRRRYYGVRVGRRPGVFDSWDEARASVGGYPGAVFRRFDTPAQARAYVAGASSPRAPVTVHVSAARVGQNGDGPYRYGVYWGRDDPRNESAPVPGDVRSERRAALYAMGRAVRALAADRWPGVAHVCTDCSQALIWARDYMPAWRASGWVTARSGTPPVDVDVVRSLSEAVGRCAGEVRFVHRLRKDRSAGMEGARRLAAGDAS
jgi:ribonuclease HI